VLLEPHAVVPAPSPALVPAPPHFARLAVSRAPPLV
jgi:hypothetical protein